MVVRSLSPPLFPSFLPSFTVHRTAGRQEESWRGSGRAVARSVGRSDGQGKKELVYLHDFPALSWVHAHVGTVRLRKWGRARLRKCEGGEETNLGAYRGPRDLQLTNGVVVFQMMVFCMRKVNL